MEIFRFIKKRVQSTKNKKQSSISHTPEGANTRRAHLIAAARITTTEEAHDVSTDITDLRRRPIVGGGASVPLSSAAVSWINQLSNRRNKPISRIKTIIE
jgi:hypothetical protein